jgi:hypothetical protein
MIPNLATLIDPRPHDGNRLAYCGMTMLPVAYECEWMKYNEVLQCAMVQELWELLRDEVLRPLASPATSTGPAYLN